MKRAVLKDLLIMGLSVILTVLLVNLFIYHYIISDNFVDRSYDLFNQIEVLINDAKVKNEIALNEFDKTCLDKTDAVNYIVSSNPQIIYDVDNLRHIASILDIDEIHFFDEDGILYAGSEPKYFGLSLYSNKQMQYFLPLLENKDLEMVQEICPNASSGQNMKYAALWGGDEIGIVQLGFSPENILNITSINSIERIFDQLAVSEGTELLALDKESGIVVGSTSQNFMDGNFGSLVEDFKFEHNHLHTLYYRDTAYYYMAHEIDDYYLIRTYANDIFVKSILFGVLSTSAYVMIVLIVVAIWIFGFINSSIIRNLNRINHKLDEIVIGNTNIEMPKSNIKEFNKLNSNINKVVKSLISYIRKISVVFDLTKTKVGIIDHPDNSSKAIITGNVKDILGLNKSDFDYLVDHPETLKEKIKTYKKAENLLEDNVYRLVNFDGENRYIEFEDIRYENSDITILRDVTEEINEILNLENERDTDVLTDVLNRRAFTKELSVLFEEPNKLAFAYVAIADIDGLKDMNDKYGHRKGDEMISKVAKSMKNAYDGHKALVGRVGGDEFAIFEYGFATVEDMQERIDQINRIKDTITIEIDGVMKRVHFSMGYAYFPVDSTDYQLLLHIADNSMYDDKKTYKSKHKMNGF